MAENPFDRNDVLRRDAWDEGYFAGIEDAAKVAEGAFVEQCPSTFSHRQCHTHVAAAIRAGEVRG